MDKMREAFEAHIKNGGLVYLSLAKDYDGARYTDPFVQCRWEGYLMALTPSPWIPCSERLPDDDELVWVWDADIQQPDLTTGFQVVNFRDRYDYTHWMPTNLARPEPPHGG